MKNIAIVGNPVSHSLSPQLFELSYPDGCFRYGILETEDILSVGEKLRSGGLYGVNVTSPLKVDALKIVDKISPEAEEIGAINTIVCSGQKLTGYNTDCIGVRKMVEKNIGDAVNKNFIVVGAGGACMSIVYALNKLGAKTIIINRTFEKSKKIAEKFNCNFAPITELENLLKHYKHIFIATPPYIDIIERLSIDCGHIVFDANYIDVKLRQRSILENFKYIDGRYWLMYQAIACFELFTGLKPDETKMRKFLNL